MSRGRLLLCCFAMLVKDVDIQRGLQAQRWNVLERSNAALLARLHAKHPEALDSDVGIHAQNSWSVIIIMAVARLVM